MTVFSLLRPAALCSSACPELALAPYRRVVPVSANRISNYQFLVRRRDKVPQEDVQLGS